MEENNQTPQQTESNKSVKNDYLIMGILSYLGFLCLVPLFTKKEDEFIYFHAKQGLVLFILETIVFVVYRILAGIFAFSIFTWGLLSILSIIVELLDIGFIALSIIGIVNVVQNHKKEIPFVGKFADKIKI
jgi:uncharacterized membrane protein